MNSYHEALQHDPVGQDVATLIANHSTRRRSISTGTLAIALNQSPSRISDALQLLAELDLIGTSSRSPGRGWHATAGLMAAWDGCSRPTITPPAGDAPEGFERCPLCANSNGAAVRFCTFCGTQMKRNRESARAARDLRASVRVARAEDESPVASVQEDGDRPDAGAHPSDPSMKSRMEGCNPVPLITRVRVRE